MEHIMHILEEKRDGTKIVKNFFVHESQGNILANAQSHFTKDEKKEAKLNHKLINK